MTMLEFWVAFAALCGVLAGFIPASLIRERRLDRVWRQGITDLYDRHPGARLVWDRLEDELWADDEEADDASAGDLPAVQGNRQGGLAPVPVLQGIGAGAPPDLALDAPLTGRNPHDVPRPGGVETPMPGEPWSVREPAGPGHLPSQATYRARLAAIGRDDPARWYAALTAPDPEPQPGPPPEPAWLERQLYDGAIRTARLEAWNERWMDAFHSDCGAWDRMVARWCEDARWVLVGSRSWPPPELAGAPA